MRKNNNKFDKGSNKFKGSSSRKGKENDAAVDSCDPKPANDGKMHFNDPDWYINSEQILKDTARLPYSIPVGTCFQRDGSINVNAYELQMPGYDNAIPGLFVSYLMPTLGMTDQTAESAVNVAANSLFQFVRSKISGSRKYEAVDMMLYMGALDSLYCMITWMTRLYATAYTYHQANKYYARALIEAQGVDFDNLIDNLPNFRAALNIELAKVRALYLPSVLPIFKRHSWMFSHYFKEGDSDKDQLYFHVPAGYHYFTLDDDGKGALNAVCICRHNGLWTVQYLIQMIRQMINPIFEREDFNIISGDMLKAYEGKVFSLTEIPDIATVQAAFAPDVLLQFKNAKYKNVLTGDQTSETWKNGFFNYYQDNTHHLTMIGNTPNGIEAIRCYYYCDLYTTNDNSIVGYDSTNKIVAQILQSTMWQWSKDTLLTTPSGDVNPVENMINTRLTLGFSFKADTTHPNMDANFDQLYFGSEWPICYKLYAYHRNKTTGSITLFSRSYDETLAVDWNASSNWLSSQEPIRTAFKYLPELAVFSFRGHPDHSGEIILSCPGRTLFEVDNYSLINAQSIAGLHSAAILGEYNIPNTSVHA